MDERERDREQIEDLDVPGSESEQVKGGVESPGSTVEGAEPHLQPASYSIKQAWPKKYT